MEPTAATTTVSLAVLPFQTMSDDPDIGMFCTGLVMDIITDLSRFRPFRIISYEAASRLHPEKGDLPGGAAGLHLDYLVKGLARYHNNRLLLNVQLINVGEDRLVWAEKFGGPLEELFQMQEEIVEKIAVTLRHSVDSDLLAEIRRKSLTTLSAYECWLRGLQEVKKGTLEADEEARRSFRQAMEIDPHYARAYTGMSMTYFNEWSCQIWDRWEVSSKGAFEWARKALELDERDHVSAVIVGKIHLFNGEYDKAEHFLRKGLRLNPNDVENLLQIAFSFGYLGYLKEGLQLYERAMLLNPFGDETCFACGAFLKFEMGEIAEAIELAEKHPLEKGWVDFPAFMAAAFYLSGDLERMEAYWRNFLEQFSQKINRGEPADTQTALQWMIDVNPYRGETRLRPFWEYMARREGKSLETATSAPSSAGSPNVFRQEGEFWGIRYDGAEAQLADLKGYRDIARLLSTPGQPVHVTELMGVAVVERGEEVFDERARNAYRKRLLNLQEELEEAEMFVNGERIAALREEYDRLLEMLSKSVGKGGRVRKISDGAEKARSAVTWRLRNAVRKIADIHPSLGKHLDVSIRTGVFCEYSPEKKTDWIL